MQTRIYHKIQEKKLVHVQSEQNRCDSVNKTNYIYCLHRMKNTRLQNIILYNYILIH